MSSSCLATRISAARPPAWRSLARRPGSRARVVPAPRTPPRSRRAPARVLAASTGVQTSTSARASARVVLSQTKSGEMRYSFGPPPDPRPPGSAYRQPPEPPRSPAAGGGSPDLAEEKLYAVLQCDGGVAASGLVLAAGPDDLLAVAKVYPGGAAEGVLFPGDVILACSVVVMVEREDGEFEPDFRWHDATESTAEHTLGVLMTHDGELRLRACRNYVPERDRAVRAAWEALVPVVPSRNPKETWNRLLYRPGGGSTTLGGGVSEEDPEEDTTPGGIWSGLLRKGGRRAPGDARAGARACWAAVVGDVSAEDGPVAEDSDSDSSDEGGVEAPGADEREEARGAAEKAEAEVVCVIADVEVPEEDIDAAAEATDATEAEEAAESKTWDEFEVTLDCTAGVNMTGLQFAQREDGLLRVSVCKPGGTAAKKVKIGDVLLATTYVVMVPDPTGERRAGIPTLEWMDAVNEGHSFNTLQEAMMTHAQEMKLKLARGDVPIGAMTEKTEKSRENPAAADPTKLSPEAEAELRYLQAEKAREAKAAMKAASSVGSTPVPDDIKAWAAKIAAEARAGKR